MTKPVSPNSPSSPQPIRQASEWKSLENVFPLLLKELKSEKLSDQELNHIGSMLKTGKSVATALLDINRALPESSSKNALALTWLLMASSYQTAGDTFTRGTVRIHPLSEIQAKRFKEFFANCSEANAQRRMSSHFKEMTIGSQRGLEFPKGSLPMDKELSTLLCGRLNDNSFFIKLEREPISLTRPLATIQHMYNWAKHAQSGGGQQTVGNKLTRRETDEQKTARQHYEDIISSWYKINSSRFSPLPDPSSARVFTMFNTVMELQKQARNSLQTREHPEYPALKQSIFAFCKSIEPISDPHIASGREVLVDVKEYLSK